ncbi:hypothetical protein D018_1461A, partial [Vibrio parahaemolyticus VP2007-007]
MIIGHATLPGSDATSAPTNEPIPNLNVPARDDAVPAIDG